MTLELRGASKVIRGITHIKPTSLLFEPGHFNVLLGQTGSGKTSMIKLMAGLDPLATGQILMNGEDVSSNALLLTDFTTQVNHFSCFFDVPEISPILDEFLYENLSEIFKVFYERLQESGQTVFKVPIMALINRIFIWLNTESNENESIRKCDLLFGRMSNEDRKVFWKGLRVFKKRLTEDSIIEDADEVIPLIQELENNIEQTDLDKQIIKLVKYEIAFHEVDIQF